MNNFHTLLFILGLLQMSLGEEQIPEKVECINLLEDLKSNKWTAQPDFKYAATWQDLPDYIGTAEDRQKLEANGIFYLEGSEFIKFFRKSGEHFANITPSYLYVRFSQYETAQRYPYNQPYVVPSAYYDRNYIEQLLESSFGYWQEKVIPLQMGPLLWTGIDLGAYFYQPGGYFFVDQIILVQGKQYEPYYDAGVIRALCPNVPSRPFVCDHVGYFPEPNDCHAFHQCYQGQGGLEDSLIKCQGETVWCQEKLACAHLSEECPCNSN